MKYTFGILLLSLLVLLSGCGKKDAIDTTDLNGNNNGLEAEVLPEATGEESIVPQYIDSSSDTSTTIGVTDEKILFFYSEDSEKSKEFDAILNSAERPEIFSDIIKINFDDESEAKENYGIVEANTFVLVDESGTLVKKIENVGSIENILTLYD